MTLNELAQQYLDTAANYAARVKELLDSLRAGGMSAEQARKLRIRIETLDNMGLEARATGRYLAKYYGY